ncbi:MAG: glycosyltransferase family 4 protein [Butyrivibrio sp.]|uniref:glycosyltransferase family 4 protein n=1 Tax=Butyrivibrio sp. TaxID=28121 RepID=UPI001EC7A4B2|nr:glycosyltransferase family 4 protein [Butyrivibrio sp.]MBE5840873.1 glycosyltransferase family 4 protein [Butyrivibrio sp.]
MKIIFIVNHDYLSKNGIAIVTQYLAEGLVKKGHHVKVYTVTNDKEKPLEHNGVMIETIDLRYNRLKQPKGEIDRYRKKVLAEKSDVIIFVSLQTPATDCLLPLLDDIKAKKLLYTHDFSGLYLKPLKWRGDLFHSLGNTWNYFIWNYYYRFHVPKYINKFNGVISLSALNKDNEYLKHYYRGKKWIIGNAAEDIFFESSQSDRMITEKYLISVANYSHIKNQIFIIKEYYKTKASTEYAMVFCGSSLNKYADRLQRVKKALDKKYGERKVRFLHGIDRQLVPALIRGASLYLCGSRWEAFSISMIEAMASGTPFVSVDAGNVRELPGGIVVDSNKDFHLTIDEMLDNEALLADYSRKGMEYANSRCRIEVAVNKLETILENVIDSKE